jgi:alkaline phosphatase D
MYVLLVTLLSFSSYAKTQFLVSTDIHYGAENSAKDGEDTGPEFLRASMDKMKELSQQVDFIINLGDMPTHTLFNSPKKADYERTLFHELFAADSAEKPMFYIPGNNDSLAGNYQAFEVQGESPLNYAHDWQGSCVFCKELIIDDGQMRHGGYYSSYVMPHNKQVMLIALNTAPFVKIPITASPYPDQDADAQAELSWLEQQLKDHAAKQLIIAMHVPPGDNYKGNPFWHSQYLKEFVGLLTKYHKAYGQISLLSGHTHMDELRKIPLADGVNLYDYSTAAISRYHYNNPAIKIVSLDDDRAVSNYTTYYTTQLGSWGDEHYQAMSSPDAIFPQCHTKTVAECLNSLSDKQVCDALEGGLFYGAKSDRVPKACEKAYLVKVS